MMVALLLYAYARGMRSSRVIERACVEDVAFRVIAAQQRPDHATIARFIERHEDAIAGLFGEVLALCARRGAGGGRGARGRRHEGACERVAHANRRLRAARARDPRGGQGDRRGRGRALRRRPRRRVAAGARDRAGPARLAARSQAAPGGRARPRTRSRCRASRPKRVKEAKRRLEEELWTEASANEAYEAYRARGRDEGRAALRSRRAKPYTPPATPEGRINVTDPDSKVVKALRGYIQGYNAQAVINEHQIVIAAEIDDRRRRLRAPRADARRRPARTRSGRRHRTPGVVLADAGYWHQRADGAHRSTAASRC